MIYEEDPEEDPGPLPSLEPPTPPGLGPHLGLMLFGVRRPGVGEATITHHYTYHLEANVIGEEFVFLVKVKFPSNFSTETLVLLSQGNLEHFGKSPDFITLPFSFFSPIHSSDALLLPSRKGCQDPALRMGLRSATSP